MNQGKLRPIVTILKALWSTSEPLLSGIQARDKILQTANFKVECTNNECWRNRNFSQSYDYWFRLRPYQAAAVFRKQFLPVATDGTSLHLFCGRSWKHPSHALRCIVPLVKESCLPQKGLGQKCLDFLQEINKYTNENKILDKTKKVISQHQYLSKLAVKALLRFQTPL